MTAHVHAPGTVAKGDVFEVKTLIDHAMETGLRRTSAGDIIPRKIINRFTCFYNDEAVFCVDLHEAVAANPFVAFYVAATESGYLKFVWEEDGGAIFALEKPITVKEPSESPQLNRG